MFGAHHETGLVNYEENRAQRISKQPYVIIAFQ